ncbi:MAG: acyltransferase [Rhizobiaceae bacterium]|nr:MAG: acyltransferase [Rhizobiaceae bacterium]
MNGLNARYLTADELAGLAFASCGENVRIHSTAVLVNCQNISLADHIRIDPFCVISAGTRVTIGRNVHIASFASVIGAAEVEIGDFVGISQGCRILAASDDFDGTFLTGPTLPAKYTRVHKEPVRLDRHAVVGAGSVVLPGCEVGEGAIVGALSLVNQDLEPWRIYAGVPARAIRDRKRDLLALEAEYLRQTPPPHLK